MPRKQLVPDQVARRLIEEVKARECLWNPENDRYNDRYKMTRAWMEIADELKISEERLRLKWKNLRDLFKKEVKKFGSADEYSGKWRYYDALTFLRNRTEDADKTSEQNEHDDSNCETKQEIAEEYTPDENDVEIYFDDAFEDPLPDKKRKLSSDEDYDVMFLKSLAPYFKQLDPIRKLVVRSKMQDMLLNEIAAKTSASHLQLRKQS